MGIEFFIIFLMRPAINIILYRQLGSYVDDNGGREEQLGE